MDWAIFWAIIAVVVSAVGVLWSVFTYRRKNPTRKISYSISQSALLNIANDRIKVLVEDKVVHNAYSTSLYIISPSRADIASSSFDAGRPLVFDFGDEIISSSRASRDSLEFFVEGSAIRIPPQLIRKGLAVNITLILDGRTRLCIVSNPLIDIEVDGGPDEPLFVPRGNRMLTALLVASAVMAVGVGVLLVAGIVFNLF